MHWVAFQFDRLYSVAEDECRAHLKYNITNFLNILICKISRCFIILCFSAGFWTLEL